MLAKQEAVVAQQAEKCQRSGKMLDSNTMAFSIALIFWSSASFSNLRQKPKLSLDKMRIFLLNKSRHNTPFFYFQRYI